MQKCGFQLILRFIGHISTCFQLDINISFRPPLKFLDLPSAHGADCGSTLQMQLCAERLNFSVW